MDSLSVVKTDLRSVHLTNDVELAIEIRLSSAVRWSGHDSDLSLEAFAARALSAAAKGVDVKLGHRVHKA